MLAAELLDWVLGLATAWSGIFPNVAIAQMLPFEHYKVEPIDPRQAFVEGYRAYQNREWPSVIERMQLAVVQVPELHRLRALLPGPGPT